MPSYKVKIERGKAVEVATPIKECLAQRWIKCLVCGSVRRGMEMVNDVDMVVQAPADVVGKLIASACKRLNLEYELKGRELTPERKAFDCIIEGIQFNIMITRDESWGAAIMHLTGGQFFNIMMRGRAKKLGYKLNEKGLFHGEEQIAGRTEEQIFKALMIKHMRPEERSIKYGDYLPVDGLISLKDNLDKERQNEQNSE